MPVSDLISTRRRRGSLETIKQSEYNRKRGNSTAAGGGEGKEEDDDNTGNNAKEFRRKTINTGSNFPNNNSSRKTILANTKTLDDEVEAEVDVKIYKAVCDDDDDDENGELLFSSSLLCIDNSIIIDLAKQKIKGGERFYHNNKQQSRWQRQHEQEKQYDDDHWYNNDFASFDEDDVDDDDDDRSEEEKQQLRKFPATSCCTRTRKTTMQRSQSVRTNECSQLYSRQHYQHSNLEQKPNSKLLRLEQFQQEHQIVDSQTIVLSHPRLLLNEHCTPNNNNKSLVVLHNKNNISDKWRRIGRNNGYKKGYHCSSNLRTSSEESGENPERNDVGTVKVDNFVTTSTMRPMNFNGNNRIASCNSRDASSGRGGSCKNKPRSSFCDNQLINKLISSEVVLLFGERILRKVFPMMNRKSQRWRRKESNVFTLFNFISVFVCLLLCFSNCHQVNCVEVHETLSARASTSSTDFNNLKEGGGVKRESYSGMANVETVLGSFGKDENSVQSSSSTEITSKHDDPSSFSSFHDYMYRGHLLDKRSSGSSDAPPPADVGNNRESYLDGGGGNSNDSIMTLTEDRNKSNQFTATNGVSFNNVDGERKEEGDDDSSRNIGDGVSNKDQIEPRESDDINSRAQQNNSNTLEERAAQGKSFLRVERNTKGKTNDDHKGLSTSNTGGDAGSVHTNEPSPFEKMSGDEPTKDHFYKSKLIQVLCVKSLCIFSFNSIGKN